MTFCLAFATERWALVASDTRARLWAGGTVDEDDVRKLYRLPGGWCVGGGWTALREVAIAALADADLREPPTVLEALRGSQPMITEMLASLGDEQAPGLSADVLGCPSIRENCARTAQLRTVAAAPAGGFVCRVYDPVTATQVHEVRDSGIGSTPGGLDPADVTPLLASFGHGVAVFRPDLCGAIRMTASLFRDVRAQMGPDPTISASVTLGFLDADGAFWILPHAADALIAMTDAALRGLREPSPEPTRYSVEETWR